LWPLLSQPWWTNWRTWYDFMKRNQEYATLEIFYKREFFFYTISEVGCGLLHVIYISIISYCYNLKWPRKHNGLRYTLKMWGVQNRKRRPLGLSPPVWGWQRCLSQSTQRAIFMHHWKAFTKYVLRCSMYILFSYTSNRRCLDLADIFYYGLSAGGGGKLGIRYSWHFISLWPFIWPRT